MKLTFFNTSLLAYPELIAPLIEHGQVSYEEMEEATQEYNEWKAALMLEWPPPRVKEVLLGEMRRKCEWCIKKIHDIEQKNWDERAKGVSYPQRRKYTTQIETLRKMFEEYKQKGLLYKKSVCNAEDFFTPSNYDLIHLWGFEKYLKYATL